MCVAPIPARSRARQVIIVLGDASDDEACNRQVFKRSGLTHISQVVRARYCSDYVIAPLTYLNQVPMVVDQLQAPDATDIATCIPLSAFFQARQGPFACAVQPTTLTIGVTGKWTLSLGPTPVLVNKGACRPHKRVDQCQRES